MARNKLGWLEISPFNRIIFSPLVMYLWVPKFVDAFDVVNCFLFLHVCVEEPGSCVVGELAEEVLGFIGCAR